MKMRITVGMMVLSMAVAAQANLLDNGDFELGDVGFNSAHIFDSEVNIDGTYTVSSTVPNNWAPGFGDHTTGSGLMLIVNSSTDAEKTFWSQEISTWEGGEYTLSGWIAVVTGPGIPVPTLQVRVDGESVGSWSIPDVDDTWQSFSFDWIGNGAVQTISLHDTNAQAVGCDFALDDMQAIPEPATASLMALVGGLVLLVRRRFMS